MAVTSQIARIRVGPNSRNKTTLYTSTRVTKNAGDPPSYSTEIIQYTDAKRNGAVVIGTQSDSNPGKIIWNESAPEIAKKYESFVAKASSTQVKSVSSDIATTAQEKAALNKVSGSNNAAVNSGTDAAKPAGGQGNQDINTHNTHNRGGAGSDVDTSTEGGSDDTGSSAGSSAGSSSGNFLVYPNTLRQSKQDTIWFTRMAYVAKGLGGSGSFTTGERTMNDRQSKGKVVLPIPAGIGDSNTTSWETGSMDAAKLVLGRIALAGIQEGLTKAGVEAADTLKNIGGSGAEDVKKALASNLAGAATGDNKAIMQRAEGQVMNPNMEMLFSGPGMRTFTFTFNFTARSAREGKTILQIIKFFKEGMAPIKSESNLFLKSPDTFKLEYKNGSQIHKGLNRFKECACTSCGLQYTPDGNYSTYEDGIMTKYQMSLGFAELEPVFSGDYAEFSKNEIGY